MTRRFAVVHEAEADFNTATELADRVLVEAVEWLDEDQLAYQREWVGTVPVASRLTWKFIARHARELGIKAHGRFGDEPGEPDARAARLAILYLLETVPNLCAVLLIRDQDDQPERRHGLEQAREQDRSGLPIVVGFAVVEREAWVLSGFDPQNDEEATRLATERQTLSFCPCERSHELTAGKNDQAPRSPKRVLLQLSRADPDRERLCWRATPLDRLRVRGTQNGLADYLHEIRHHLAPLIGHVPGT